MKKIIALLLSAIICLPLVACGGESPTGNNNSETKQEAGGNNNSAENNDATVDGSIAPTIAYGVGQSAFADHPCLPCIYGTWCFERSNAPWEYTGYKTLSIYRDGSCEVDGTFGNWKIEDVYSTKYTLCIGIYCDGELICGAYFGADFMGVYLLACIDALMSPTQTTFINNAPECLYSTHPVFPVLCGTYTNEMLTAASITITNDGKCTVNGNSGTWDFYSDYTNGHHEPYHLGVAIALNDGTSYYAKVFENGTLEFKNADNEDCGVYTKIENE